MFRAGRHSVVIGAICALLSGCVCVYPPDSELHSEMRKSAKRGVSFDFKQAEDLPLLSPSCSWAYNWGNTQNAQAALWFDSNDMDFCPMAWNNTYNADAIRQYVQAHPKTKYLLGFNEPNLKDQCNMTPAEAAAHWGEVVALANELHVKLVSPAMNYGTLDGYSDPVKWLDEFFAQPGVSLADIDAIAVHCYMSSPSAVRNYIEMFRKYGKPVWLTEFCAWDPVPGSVESQMDYMCAVLNYLEQEPLVERYAWFMPRTSSPVDKAPYMQLLTHTSPVELTDLGVLFTRFSSFDKKAYLPIVGGVGAHQYVGVSTDNISLRVDSERKPYIFNMQEGVWADYQVSVAQQSTLKLTYATVVNSIVNVYQDGSMVATIDMPKTGGMNTLGTVEVADVLSRGNHTLRIEVVKGGFNFYKLAN
mgnify:CR=1 FL=1